MGQVEESIGEFEAMTTGEGGGGGGSGRSFASNLDTCPGTGTWTSPFRTEQDRDGALT
jgi:hypothetical protein